MNTAVKVCSVGVAAMVFVALSVVLVSAQAPDEAMVTDPLGKIAFCTSRDGNYDIYEMDANFDYQIRLKSGDGWNWNPDWSPDGTQVAYYIGGGGVADIYVRDLASQADTRLTSTGNAASPRWSPDGTMIAFNTLVQNNADIYVMRLDENLVVMETVRLTTDDAEDNSPKFSPEGDQIAFNSYRGGSWDIWVMDLSFSCEDESQFLCAGDPENVTRDGKQGYGFDWSPDGTRLAVASTRGGYKTEIYVFNLDDRSYDDPPVTVDEWYNMGPSWSPDGEWIAYSEEVRGGEICMTHLDTGVERCTDNSWWDSGPDWWMDTTPPTTTILLEGTEGTNEWLVSPVDVTLLAMDDPTGSGVAYTKYRLNEGGSWISYAAPFEIGNEGTTTILAYSEDNHKNVEDPPVSEEVRIDFTPPTIDGSGLPTANANGWNNEVVTAHFDCYDAVSGVASCTADTIVSNEGAGQSVGGTAVDMAGNRSSAAVGDINIDLTPPLITGGRFPGANSHGWNNEDVTVWFECSDALSGIASCTPDTVLSNEGEGQSVTGIAMDLADNASATTVSDVNIDKTDPTVNITDLSPNPADVSESTNLVADLADELSGIQAAQWCAESESLACTWEAVTLDGEAGDLNRTASATISGLSPGVYSVKVKAQDLADNEADVAQAFLVVYEPSAGFATGGGWIIPGTAPGDFLPGITGEDKANFGFVVRYKKGATTPDGQLEFHYRVGDFNLHSAEMLWMVINDNWAKFQGYATINLHPDELFHVRVDARDAHQGDRFILKVWTGDQDPNLDDPVYRASGDLMGGNIIIHTK